MAAKVVEVGIVLNDAQLKRKLKAQEKAWKKTKRSILSVKNAMLAFAVGTIGRKFASFMKDSVKIAQEHSQAQTNLQTALRATAGAAGYSYEELQIHATELAKTTKFSVRAIMGAQAELATFVDVTGPMFQDVLQGALDISMVFGSDLPHALVRLAKAFQDPQASMKQLRKTGISLSPVFMDMVINLQKSGKLVEAQAALMKELQVQGLTKQAQEAMASGVMQLSLMQKAYESLKGAIGDGLGGAFLDLTGRIEGAQEATEVFDESIQQGIALTVRELAADIQKVYSAGRFLSNIGQAMGSLITEPIGFSYRIAMGENIVDAAKGGIYEDVGDLISSAEDYGGTDRIYKNIELQRIHLDILAGYRSQLKGAMTSGMKELVDELNMSIKQMKAQMAATR